MSPARNDPCPCGSGKKYKKCCLGQDEKAAAEARAQRREAEESEHEQQLAEEAAFVKHATELEELTNHANDLIRSNQWDEAEACCRQLLDRFPDEIDGHWRFYECCKARGDFRNARTHARATLQMVESREGFDPSFPAGLKKDIALFDEHIQTDGLTA